MDSLNQKILMAHFIIADMVAVSRNLVQEKGTAMDLESAVLKGRVRLVGELRLRITSEEPIRS